MAIFLPLRFLREINLFECGVPKSAILAVSAHLNFGFSEIVKIALFEILPRLISRKIFDWRQKNS